jgi:hypothetical protein
MNSKGFERKRSWLNHGTNREFSWGDGWKTAKTHSQDSQCPGQDFELSASCLRV